MQHELQITITGRPASGKTTLAAFVAKALNDAGVANVTFEDPEHTPHYVEEHRARAGEILRDRKVTIEMVQAQRPVSS